MPGGEDKSPLGVVLAGGPGRRLGGNKPQRLLGGMRLVDWAIRALGQVCPELVISTQDPADLADLSYPVIGDRWPGQGPLAALVTVFMETRAEAVLVLAVDLPLARPALLRLLARGPEKDQARAPLSPGGMEPLMAYYHRSCLPAALRLLRSGDRRPRMLLKAVGANMIPVEEVARVDPEGISLFNVNYPADLERAEELLAQWSV